MGIRFSSLVPSFCCAKPSTVSPKVSTVTVSQTATKTVKVVQRTSLLGYRGAVKASKYGVGTAKTVAGGASTTLTRGAMSVSSGLRKTFSGPDDQTEVALRKLEDQQRQRLEAKREIGDESLLASRPIGSHVAKKLLQAKSKKELVKILRSDEVVMRMADRLWPFDGDDDLEDADAEGAGLSHAIVGLDALEHDTDEWATQRAKVATMLRQGNSYVTWALALRDPALREKKLFFARRDGNDACSATPASLGVTPCSSFTFLKGLDLGGGDQRKLFALLEEGEIERAHALLVKNKRQSTNRSYILTGGSLIQRRSSAERLAAVFSPPTYRDFTFVCIAPELEGQLTLRSTGAEIRRMLVASNRRLTHALLIAKGSTDMHLAWMDAAGQIASGPGNTVSSVHCESANQPSTAKQIFLAFMEDARNKDLLSAAISGNLAIVLAGASVHVVGATRASGNYFKRLTRNDLEAAHEERAEFERYVTLAWNDEVISRQPDRSDLGSNVAPSRSRVAPSGEHLGSDMQTPRRGRNLVFVGN